jgi:hypothetical protein
MRAAIAPWCLRAVTAMSEADVFAMGYARMSSWSEYVPKDGVATRGAPSTNSRP